MGASDQAEPHARAALALAENAVPAQVAPLRLELADVLIDRDRLDEASALIPATPGASLADDQLLSRLAFQRGDYAAAADVLRPYFQNASSVLNQDVGAMQRLAQALRMLGEHQEALRLLARGVVGEERRAKGEEEEGETVPRTPSLVACST